MVDVVCQHIRRFLVLKKKFVHAAHIHRRDSFAQSRYLLHNRPIRLLIFTLRSVAVGKHGADENKLYRLSRYGAEI